VQTSFVVCSDPAGVAVAAPPRPQPVKAERSDAFRQRYLQLKSKYDAAQQTDDLKRYWANADAMSARQANHPAVRYTLRNRARYLRDNNEHADGLVTTYADHVVGVGPTLQVLTPDGEVNDAIERRFYEWSEAIRLPEKLHLMCQAKVGDGETFAIAKTNPRLETPVQLDFDVLECEQVATGADFELPEGKSWVDGIVFDRYGNPESYHVLAEHPGTMLVSTISFAAVVSGKYRIVPARDVVHWFRCKRPGQARGVPEIVSCMERLGHLHRFEKATILAAEKAAMLSVLLKTPLPAEGAASSGEPFEELELALDMMMTLPEGTEPFQMKSEHPAQSHEMYIRQTLKGVGRPLGMPYIVLAGDSSMSNLSSARLDMLIFRRPVAREREHCRRQVLCRFLDWWLEEAALVPGYLPDLTAYGALPHKWQWPGWDYMDPLKDAQADTERLHNGTTTRTAILAARGEDYEELLQQEQQEKDLEKEYGVTRAPLPGSQGQPGADQTSPDDGSGDTMGDGNVAANARTNGRANGYAHRN
jgi:lambda family phage portal protein